MPNSISPNHELWMRVALEEADAASVSGEIPIGAIVVAGDRMIGRGHNRSIGLSDPTGHAEVMALRDAGARIGN
ncbi:MAG: deaminase, partial [Rhodospirillales bacterium]|nr:deaminase [Rhodospirillales bacterium]